MSQPQQVKVAARSRFLTTLDCALAKNDGKSDASSDGTSEYVYKLEMKVNQGPCPRKEGERYKPLADNLEGRLLKNFFVTGNFESIDATQGLLILTRNARLTFLVDFRLSENLLVLIKFLKFGFFFLN